MLKTRRPLPILVMFVAVTLTVQASAIDNPDAPDYQAEFEARAKPMEAKITVAADNATIAKAQAEYAKFLDAELNKAYGLLMKKIKNPRAEALKQSQKKWLAFRDGEFAFIDGNWTKEEFGSSASISRGEFRNSLVRNRVRDLLGYLKQYP